MAQINATISSIDNILCEKNIDDPHLEEKLSEIERLTKYMSNTIEDFRTDFANKKPKKGIRLNRLLLEAIDVVRQSCEDNDIQIIENFAEDCECRCSKNKLLQIVVILLNNAKDALLIRNTFNAKIKVTLEKIDLQYRISIYDNAGGISKSVRDKIFDPYYTTKHSSEGTGIGLSMAKKIIQENYNGSLDVKNIDEGSCFTIYLPYDLMQEQR